MKIATLMVLLSVCATSAAVAQRGGNTPVTRPNSSNFGWQDRQREADEAGQKYKVELQAMSEEQWKETALAIMAFESSERSFSFGDVVRIGGATADRKAESREAEGSSDESPAWIVEFGKKKPKVLTVTLTDRAHTEVQCEADPLLETGKGYLAIFQTEFEVFCQTRRNG